MTHAWWTQHAELDDLVEALKDALQHRGGAAEDALARFARALDEHFSLEETVYFALAHRLCPDLAPRLSQAQQAHGLIRAEIARLSERLRAGDLAHVEPLVPAILDALGEHERIESQLIRLLAERAQTR